MQINALWVKLDQESRSSERYFCTEMAATQGLAVLMRRFLSRWVVLIRLLLLPSLEINDCYFEYSVVRFGGRCYCLLA